MCFDIWAEQCEEAILNDAIITLELAALFGIFQIDVQSEMPTLLYRVAMGRDVTTRLVTDQPKVAFQPLGFHQTDFAVAGALPPVRPAHFLRKSDQAYGR